MLARKVSDVDSPSTSDAVSAGQDFLSRSWPVLLAFVTLLSRLVYTSAPYYVDGPTHVAAIRSGEMFIQPPGYLVFADLGWALTSLFPLSPAMALHLVNIVASAAGVLLFALVARRLFDPRLAVVLSSCYAFSDVIWFVSETHSTYALSAALVMGLVYLTLRGDAGWWMGLVWALQAGIRPSEGVFTLPFLLITMWRRDRLQLLRFASVAIPVVALWYVPTVHHFGGGVLSPLRSAGGQAGPLANGLLTHEVAAKKIANLIHLACSVFNAWNLLSIAVVAGLVLTKDTWIRSLAWLLWPGFAFYTLIFFSDPAYLAYLVAPGLLLAGEGLRRLSVSRRLALGLISLSISISQMVLFRPIVPHSTATAVLNSYVLEYSGWAIRHQYFMRLEKAMRELSTAEPRSVEKP